MDGVREPEELEENKEIFVQWTRVEALRKAAAMPGEVSRVTRRSAK